MNNKPIKVLLAKAGLDDQNKEIRLIARGLRDQGEMEVTYTGLFLTLEEVVETALQKDVDLVGLYVHNGSHNDIFPRLRELLDSKKAGNILVFGGGLIPEQHRQELKATGAAAEIFEPGTSISVIIDWINEKMAAQKREKSS